ncbi:MAG: type I methionyl aminopeptidase [Phycisphaerales bacterium]|nr:type I methionyl aminopeptidase [Phycisphaerales bacterium]
MNPPPVTLDRPMVAPARPVAASTRSGTPIPIRTEAEIACIGAAGRIVADALASMVEAAAPGVTTAELDAIAREVIDGSGGTSLFRHYPTYEPGTGFPGTVCISVNDEVVHGIPGPRALESGDVVTVDCGVGLGGWCGDAARTFVVGDAAIAARDLITTAESILQMAIDMVQPGVWWSEIAAPMARRAEESGYGVVTAYVGHGIGRRLHESPQIPAFVSKKFRQQGDFPLLPGMVLAIEPMLTLGTSRTLVSSDGWTVRTEDGLAACHVEHTVAVRAHGAEVLTSPRAHRSG